MILQKKFKRVLYCVFMFSLIGNFVGCAHYPELTPLDISLESNKTIFVDTNVWLWMVPRSFEEWYNILKLKKSIAFKLEDYLKRSGWTVVDYHKGNPQKIYKVSNKILYDPNTGTLDYAQWIARSKWIYKLRLTNSEIQNIIKSNYLLTFLIYPNPNNLYEFKYDIFFIKLKSQKRLEEVLTQKKGELSFYEMIYNLSEKIKRIRGRDLLFTPKKIVDYTATSIFMSLKKEGML